MSRVPSPGDDPASIAVERSLLDAMRSRRGQPVPATDEAWTACSAPTHTIVADADGDLRACPFAAHSIGDADARISDAPALTTRLREQLAAARLPTPHCDACIARCDVDHFSSAPIIREPRDGTGRELIVVLAADGSHPRAEELCSEAALDGITSVHIQGDDALASELTDSLLAACQERRLPVTIRTRDLPEVDQAVAQLRNATIAALEVATTTLDRTALERAAEIASATGAAGHVRFVFTRERWFDFEDVILTAAEHGLQAHLRVLADDGTTPIEPLATESASFLRDAVVDEWSRLSGADRPTSLAENEFELLTHELRALVGRSLQHKEAENAPGIALPGLDHASNTDPERCAAWHARLFHRSLTDVVGDWVAQTADTETVTTLPWLRALVQRISFDHEPPALLDLLGRVYKKAKDHQDRLAEDESYAQSFNLERFGGPWFERIGLGTRQRRTRPFQVRDPSPVSDDTPDTTVLIPSFRHQRFIKETIASVLAQQDASFRVLVADDRSPDKTVEVAQSIEDPRVTVRVNEANIGLGNSVLQALAHIDTPYVALLNSDDLLHPEHLATCREVLDRDPDAQLVCTDLQPIDSLGRSLRPDNVSLVRDGSRTRHWIEWFEQQAPRDDLDPTDFFGELLERNYLITSSNLFVRTDWLRRQAASLQSLKYCLDWRLFLQAAAESTLRHVRKPLIGYRLHASNTVWFDAERRYTYYLEVNRVAAEALREFAERHPQREQAVERVVSAVAHHVVKNGETDGFALFLNAALDALVLEREANESTETMQLLRLLSDAADARRLKDSAPPIPSRLYQEIEHLRSLLNSEAGRRGWLESHAFTQERRIGELDAVNREIWTTKQQLERDLKSANGSLGHLRQQLETQRQRASEQAQQQRQQADEKLERVRQQLQKELEWTRGEVEKAREILEKTRAYVENLQGQIEQLQKQLQADKQAHERERQAHQEERDAHQRTRHQLQDRAQALEQREQELHQTRDALDQEHGRATALEDALRAQERVSALLRRDLADRTRDHDRSLAESARLLASREHRIGDFVWNKLPLSWASRKLTAINQRFHDARARRSLQRHPWKPQDGELGRAVVASTFSWPIQSHTFVYQEVAGMIDAGLDVRFVHWTHEPNATPHAAFAHLTERTVRIRDLRSIGRKDVAWFEQTRPDRARSFLERLAKETGGEVDALRETLAVQRAFTFARYTELIGARYVHSYFCYEMSFMAMAAAWLLDLPRGLTCYADHVLRDDPWKLVPMHLEQCEVVVATSRRIKHELSQLSGGAYDDKILVKPNGVDGTRFPAVQHSAPAAGQPLELLSISRVEPKKGLLELVDAVAMLTERGHKVHVHVVGSEDPNSLGSAPYALRFRQRIAERGVEAQFELHGAMPQEQLAPLFARSHAFVAPYVEADSGDKDGIPTAILEAMASALPIVATDSGSIPEVFDNEVQGLIVPQKDVAALADAIERLIAAPDLLRTYGTASRRHFEQNFDVRVTEKALHERIRQILKRRD